MKRIQTIFLAVIMAFSALPEAWGWGEGNSARVPKCVKEPGNEKLAEDFEAQSPTVMKFFRERKARQGAGVYDDKTFCMDLIDYLDRDTAATTRDCPGGCEGDGLPEAANVRRMRVRQTYKTEEYDEEGGFAGLFRNPLATGIMGFAAGALFSNLFNRNSDRNRYPPQAYFGPGAFGYNAPRMLMPPQTLPMPGQGYPPGVLPMPGGGYAGLPMGGGYGGIGYAGLMPQQSYFGYSPVYNGTNFASSANYGFAPGVGYYQPPVANLVNPSAPMFAPYPGPPRVASADRAASPFLTAGTP